MLCKKKMYFIYRDRVYMFIYSIENVYRSVYLHNSEKLLLSLNYKI